MKSYFGEEFKNLYKAWQEAEHTDFKIFLMDEFTNAIDQKLKKKLPNNFIKKFQTNFDNDCS